MITQISPAVLNPAVLATLVPTGTLHMWPTSVPPSGHLLCNGQAVSRTTYSSLFSILGTTFGSGDGSTTFNLPNYADRMPIGAGTIASSVGASGGSATTALSVSNLPSHNHSASVSDPGHQHTIPIQGGNGSVNGANSLVGSPGQDTGRVTESAGTGISVSVGSTGSGTPATTISPYLGINFIIKT